MTAGLEMAAVLPRAPVEDVLIEKIRQERPVFPLGATVATGSVRRQHQVRWKYPGTEIVDVRGNVPTRLRKLIANDWDAIVLARAGIERLGYDLGNGSLVFEGSILHAEILSHAEFLPAGGQGVIALQVEMTTPSPDHAQGRERPRHAFVFAGGTRIPAPVARRLRLARRCPGDDRGSGADVARADF